MNRQAPYIKQKQEEWTAHTEWLSFLQLADMGETESAYRAWHIETSGVFRFFALFIPYNHAEVVVGSDKETYTIHITSIHSHSIYCTW